MERLLLVKCDRAINHALNCLNGVLVWSCPGLVDALFGRDVALGGYGIESMKNALTETACRIPTQLVRSLTWDRGKELSEQAAFTIATTIPVYFADPQSPWQRATNENSNGLLRQYFPKDTDLSRWSAEDLDAIAHTLNTRPRKILGWRTPSEAFAEHLQSLHQAGVATTD